MVIWKQELNLDSVQRIILPKGSQILKVAEQDGKICLWFMHTNYNKEYDVRVIRIFGTGHEFNAEGLKHIDTLIMGLFVWHVFEEINND